jgi:hypothetical protein
VNGEAASADTLAANNFIPGCKKMVKEEGNSPKQMFNVGNTIYHTKCEINITVVYNCMYL